MATCLDCGKELSKRINLRCRPCWRESIKGEPKSLDHRIRISMALSGKTFEEAKNHLLARDLDSPIHGEKWKMRQRESHLQSGTWRPIGSVYIHPKGYALVKVSHGKGRGNWVAQHRHIMEKHLGKKLKSSEHIHHIDGNSLNNNIENLAIVGRREHFLLNKVVQFIADPRGGKRLAEIIVKTVSSRFL